MDAASKIAFFYILGILLIPGILFLVTAILYWLWNITMPQVFNLKEITYWQAFRLLLISVILFGGPVVL